MLNDFREETKNEPLISLGFEIEDVAFKDTYFFSRNLVANADMYGCFVYTALYVYVGST